MDTTGEECSQGKGVRGILESRAKATVVLGGDCSYPTKRRIKTESKSQSVYVYVYVYTRSGSKKESRACSYLAKEWGRIRSYKWPTLAVSRRLGVIIQTSLVSYEAEE